MYFDTNQKRILDEKLGEMCSDIIEQEFQRIEGSIHHKVKDIVNSELLNRGSFSDAHAIPIHDIDSLIERIKKLEQMFQDSSKMLEIKIKNFDLNTKE